MKVEGKHTISIRMSDEEWERFDTAARERMLSRNFLAVRLIQDGLARLIPLDEWKLTR
jgi:predicted transcriptional regulator